MLKFSAITHDIMLYSCVKLQLILLNSYQGRRRLLKSGPAMKHQRRFTGADGTR